MARLAGVASGDEGPRGASAAGFGAAGPVWKGHAPRGLAGPEWGMWGPCAGTAVGFGAAGPVWS